MQIRFYLDEHIDPAIADGLRRRNIDVVTTTDAALNHATDEVQLEFARSDSRVLVTRDSDFLVLNANGVAHSGIVFLHSKRRSIGHTIARLVALWRTTSAGEMAARVEFL